MRNPLSVWKRSGCRSRVASYGLALAMLSGTARGASIAREPEQPRATEPSSAVEPAQPRVTEPSSAVELRERWLLHAGAGHAWGIDVNSGIRKVEYRAGLERRITGAFSLGLEFALGHFAGARSGRAVSTESLTVLPVVRWSFLRSRVGRLWFDFGFGGSASDERFPPGGTQLNGYSMFGLGAEIALGDRTNLNLTLREFHHSNGRGFVSSNPAYDGAMLHLGSSFAF